MRSNRYPEEFKIEAVRQVIERGHNVSEVTRRQGMTTHSLYAWKSKYGPRSTGHQNLLEVHLSRYYARRKHPIPPLVIVNAQLHGACQ